MLTLPQLELFPNYARLNGWRLVVEEWVPVAVKHSRGLAGVEESHRHTHGPSNRRLRCHDSLDLGAGHDVAVDRKAAAGVLELVRQRFWQRFSLASSLSDPSSLPSQADVFSPPSVDVPSGPLSRIV